MNWNPYKRIDDLEFRVNEMRFEMLQLVASTSARVRMLEQKMGRNTVLADFKDETVQAPTGLLTAEEAQRIADKRVRQNAAARKYYAKRKAKEVQP